LEDIADRFTGSTFFKHVSDLLETCPPIYGTFTEPSAHGQLPLICKTNALEVFASLRFGVDPAMQSDKEYIKLLVQQIVANVVSRT
jgi:hypothetical protein